MTTTKDKSIVTRYTETAMRLDAAFGAALRKHGLGRWTSASSDWPQDVQDAYEAKIEADEFMRQAWELWRS